MKGLVQHTMNFNTTKKLSPFQLSCGMILAEDLYINNVKLVNKDTELNERVIERIQSLYSTNLVQVYSKLEESDLEIQKKRGSEEFKQTEVHLEKFSDEAEKIFNEVISSSKIDIKGIRSLSENILTELKDIGIVIKNVIDSRDADCYIFRHSVNVAVLSSMLAKWLNMTSRDVMLITYAGLLHDIGKSKLPNAILDKQGSLTKKEFEIIKTHPVKSYEIVKAIPYIDPSVEMAVLMHHERIDGSGYPLKLTEEKIHVYAKIIAIADIFDAMTSNRAYKKKDCPLKALEALKEESFGKLDIHLCNVFIKNMIDYYVGEYALLSDGKKARILKIDINNITRPFVMVGEEYIDLSKNTNLIVEDII